MSRGSDENAPPPSVPISPVPLSRHTLSEMRTASLSSSPHRPHPLQVFEVLASVPWLDDNVLQQKELKGVAVFGLLGTLEEVGFNIRGQITRIWAGMGRGGGCSENPGTICSVHTSTLSHHTIHTPISGERDHDLITECKEAKDQAALISILFHIKKMEEEYGVPSPFIPKTKTKI